MSSLQPLWFPVPIDFADLARLIPLQIKERRGRVPGAESLLRRGGWKEGITMVELEKTSFDAAAFLTRAGLGRKIVQVKPKEVFFSQGEPADSVFYLQRGRAKVTVLSNTGKEATI